MDSSYLTLPAKPPVRLLQLPHRPRSGFGIWRGGVETCFYYMRLQVRRIAVVPPPDGLGRWCESVETSGIARDECPLRASRSEVRMAIVASLWTSCTLGVMDAVPPA